MSGDGTGGDNGEAAGPPAPSPLVQLELAILGSDLSRPGSGAAAEHAQPSTRMALIVTKELQLGSYVAECLAARTDLVAVIELSAGAALRIGQEQPPRLIVTDAQHVDLLVRLGDVPALLILDELRELAGDVAAQRQAPLRVLVRPFNARSLQGEVDRLQGPAQSEPTQSS